MLAVLDRLGYGHVTVHGSRLDLRNLGRRMHRLSRWRPRGSAHPAKYKSETTAAYQRGQKHEKRRFLMKDWAQFLAGSNLIRFDKTG